MGRSRNRRLPKDPVTTFIDTLSPDSRGQGSVEGKTVLIDGALPGEQVLFVYTGKHHQYDEGRAVQVIQASPDRVQARCEHFGICGGCSLQHLSGEAQIAAKQRALQDAFRQIGNVAADELLPPLRGNSPWGYRRKARLGAKYVVKKEKVLVGFRERHGSYIADLDRCLVLHPKVGELLEPLSLLISSLSVKSQVPQVEVAMGDEACVLIFRLLQEASDADLSRLEQFGREHDIDIYLQEAGPDSVRPLSATPADLFYRLPGHDMTIRFLPTDFTQVNTELNRLMVDRAIELLSLSPQDRVLDLFCGLGNFTLPIARRAGEAVGVEGGEGLVERARQNARDNRVFNVRFHTADLYGELSGEGWLGEPFDKALLDPPRSGAQQVLRLLPRMGIKRIVYVSCYPETLARDAGELVNEHGYRLESAGVMDMFPHTAHVESIALFTKR